MNLTGLTPDLIFAATVVLVAGVAILTPRLGVFAALSVVIVRVLVPVAYFATVREGGWRLTDDVTYAKESAELIATGGGPLDLFLDTGTNEALFRIAEGRHVGYYVQNAVALALFGEHYWAPVMLNVLLSFLGALAVWRLVIMSGASRPYARAATVFFTLQWDVVAWSSFLNLKDTLVMTLSAWAVVGALDFARRTSLVGALRFLFCSILLSFLRWYVPFLILAALGAWGIVTLRGWRRMLLVLFFAGGLFTGLQAGAPTEMIQPGGLLPGMMQFLVTPRPWGIEPRYSFLLLPALLHWLVLPLATFGGIQMWRRGPIGRALIMYFLALIVFYGMIPQLQGPRHRYQGVFVLAMAQFQGLYALMLAAIGSRNPAPGRVVGEGKRVFDLSG